MYNLEGVEAVVAAAEEERSPAMLQVDPINFRSCLPEANVRYHVTYQLKSNLHCRKAQKFYW